jgi:hypothetical protein
MNYEYTYELEDQPKWLEVTVEVFVTSYVNEPQTWDSPGYEEIEWEFVGWNACDQDGNETCGENEPPYSYPKEDITDYLLEHFPRDAKDKADEAKAEYLMEQIEAYENY